MITGQSRVFGNIFKNSASNDKAIQRLRSL